MIFNSQNSSVPHLRLGPACILLERRWALLAAPFGSALDRQAFGEVPGRTWSAAWALEAMVGQGSMTPAALAALPGTTYVTIHGERSENISYSVADPNILELLVLLYRLYCRKE